MNQPIIRSSRRGLLALAAAGALAAPATLQAQRRFPNRPIRMIIPFAAGGGTDRQMRTLCDIAARRLGEPIVIENRAGGGAVMGAIALANDRAADGHLLSQLASNTFSQPLRVKSPSFNPLTDFTYVIQVVGYVHGIAVKGDSPIRTLPQLIEHARAHPGEVTYGTTSVGGVPHITVDRIARQAGVEMTNIPYRGGVESITAVISGTITAMAGSGWMEMVQSGQMHALCVWGPRRAKALPEVPTLRELGIDIVQTTPYGFAGPRGMAPEIVTALHDAFRPGLEDPQHLAVLEREGLELDYLGPAEYASNAARTFEQNRVLFQQLGLLGTG